MMLGNAGDWFAVLVGQDLSSRRHINADRTRRAYQTRRSRPTWRNYQDCRDQILNRRQPNCVGFITPRFVLSSVAFFDLRSASDYRTFRRNPVTLFPGERASSEAIAMPTTEYYQKQIELLLLWASTTTSRDLQVKLSKSLPCVLRSLCLTGNSPRLAAW